MYTFSSYLSNLLQTHKIKKNSLSQHLGMNYSSLHQILNGKRFPASQEFVNTVASFLELSGSELEELTELWRLEKEGPILYYRKKNVADFLKRYRYPLTQENMHTDFIYTADSATILSASHCLLLEKEELLKAIQVLLNNEACVPDGRIIIILQPDQNPIMDIIRTLSSSSPCQIDHIICLNKNDDLDEQNRNTNLHLLSSILPVYFDAGITYKTFYHYDNLQTIFSSFNIMPCLIITRNYALIFQYDLQKGILFTEKTCVQLYSNLYRKCRQFSSPFIEMSPVDSGITDLLMQMDDIYIPVDPSTSIHDNLIICLNKQKIAFIHQKKMLLTKEISILSAFTDYLNDKNENSLYTTINKADLLVQLF